MKKYDGSVSPGRPKTEQSLSTSRILTEAHIQRLQSEWNTLKARCARREEALRILKDQFEGLQYVNADVHDSRTSRKEVATMEEKLKTQEELVEQQECETERLLQLATRMKHALVAAT